MFFLTHLLVAAFLEEHSCVSNSMSVWQSHHERGEILMLHNTLCTIGKHSIIKERKEKKKLPVIAIDFIPGRLIASYP